jgi:undecaprenyl-diphosphatase
MATLELFQTSAPVDWPAMILGVVLSFATAYLCIHYFLSFIERISMLPFVLYRLLLGIAIFVLIT